LRAKAKFQGDANILGENAKFQGDAKNVRVNTKFRWEDANILGENAKFLWDAIIYIKDTVSRGTQNILGVNAKFLRGSQNICEGMQNHTLSCHLIFFFSLHHVPSGYNLFSMFLKEASYAHQSCIHSIIHYLK